MTIKPKRTRNERRREKRARALAKRKLAEQRRKYSPDDDKVELQRRFSKYAYESDLNDIQDQIKDTDYVLDTSKSGREQKVFVNPGKKNVVVAYRGTKLADKSKRFKDLVSDLSIMIGLQRFNRRFSQSQNRFDSVYNKYQDYDIETTGHSLGGSLAEYINTNNPDKVTNSITFSRGTGPMDLIYKKSNTVYDVSNSYDAISAFGRLRNRMYGKNQTIDDRYNVGLNHALDDLKNA